MQKNISPNDQELSTPNQITHLNLTKLAMLVALSVVAYIVFAVIFACISAQLSDPDVIARAGGMVGILKRGLLFTPFFAVKTILPLWTFVLLAFRVDSINQKNVLTCLLAAFLSALVIFGVIIIQQKIILYLLQETFYGYRYFEYYYMASAMLKNILMLLLLSSVAYLLLRKKVEPQENIQTWSVQNSCLLLLFFIITFIVVTGTLSNGSFTQMLDNALGLEMSQMSQKGSAYLMNVVDFVIFLILLVINAATLYFLTPSAIRKLQFNRPPQVMKGFLTIAFMILLCVMVLSGITMFCMYILSYGVFSALMLVLSIVALLLLIDTFRIVSPILFGLYYALFMFICFAVAWGLPSYMKIPFLLTSSLVIPISMWFILGSIQLGIHRIYRKACDAYKVEEYSFNRSFFGCITVPLTRWI